MGPVKRRHKHHCNQTSLLGWGLPNEESLGRVRVTLIPVRVYMHLAPSRTQMESDSVLIFSVAGLPWTRPCGSAALQSESGVTMMPVRPLDWMATLVADNANAREEEDIRCRPYR